MSLFWEPHLAIGVAEIDAQHRELFDRVNGLLDAMREHRGAGQVGVLLDFLGRYVADHFQAEESLMREARYPGYEAHRREHEGFTRELRDLSRAFAEGGATPAVVVKLNVWLCDWLRRHVSDSDQGLGRFLAETRG
ncbi:MAG TPA: bacteriohemerythrin [Anaeromyxobacteraceae bacterium]|jgi:hemerythrin